VHYKKKLGQHFLVDQNIINKLVRFIAPHKDDVILEIGPGDGALSKSIIPLIKKFYLIEKDKDLFDELYLLLIQNKNGEIINSDVLKFDLTSIQEKFRIIGNLPYNISTEIIFMVCKVCNIIDIHFMLQKEVVDRMIANPNTKTYGRLSVMTQVYFQATKLFDISEHVFVPKPKVKSSFIRLLPKEYIFNDKNHEDIFYKIVKKAFEGRRKMIRSSLSDYFKEKDYDTIKIDSKKRAENLSINDYLLLSRYVYKN
jgi:16S rRNA (adenine1518-N6/adenine1519-N6)-dimethyltransferase